MIIILNCIKNSVIKKNEVNFLNDKMKRLAGNIGIFAIGNLGSKIIGFVLIAVFTRYLSTSQFGYIDLITTTINMLLPIAALSVADAVFRFSMDVDADEKQILSTGIVFTACMSIIAIVFVYPILVWLKISYAGAILAYLLASLFQAVLQNFVRGIGYVRLFAINGLVSAVILAIVGVWQVVLVHTGVKGYLIALISSAIFSVIFMGVVGKIWKFLKFDSNNKKLLKSMLRYSIPLIPNAFLWFFTNDASRYFIVGFLGMAANGLYAIATKLPTIINIFYTVFSQAWQISAVEEYRKNRHSAFFSDVFNADVGLSVILIGGILIILRPVMSIFVATNYFLAWQIVPSLLLASFFSNLASFLGTIYLATKQTMGIMKTTFYGMIANILFNFTLIPIFGIQGAGIGAALGFAFVTWIRLHDIKRIVELRVNWLQLIISIVIVILMAFLQFLMNMNSIILYVLLVVMEIILIGINGRELIKRHNK